MSAPDNSEEDYRKATAVNWSTLKAMAKSPKHYKWALDHQDEGDTASRGMLRAIHCLVLEPAVFDRDFAVVTNRRDVIANADEAALTGTDDYADMLRHLLAGRGLDAFVVYEGKHDKRTADYKAFQADNPGKALVKAADMQKAQGVAADVAALRAGCTLLSEKEHEEATTIAAAVRADSVARRYLMDPHARFEGVMRWTDDKTGLPCKGRFDLLILIPSEDRAILIDLKGARRVDQRGLARDSGDMLYHGQCAHYADGVRASYGVSTVQCGILAYEAKGPHDVTLAWLDPDTDLWAGEVLRDRLMARVKECRESGEWPGQHPEPITLNLPPYHLPDHEDDTTTTEEN